VPKQAAKVNKNFKCVNILKKRSIKKKNKNLITSLTITREI